MAVMHGQFLTENPAEIVLSKNGLPHQAGTLGESTAYISLIRQLAEQSLYYFSKVFMGGNILRPQPHGQFCAIIQTTPPRRKLLLAPRDHLKTTISKSLCLHVLIQPNNANIYFPAGMGLLSHTTGTSTRVLLASKASNLSTEKLIFIKTWCETHARFLHAMWPEVFWEHPAKQAAAWNNESLLFPRRDIFDQNTIEVTGVGGTITGQRFNILLHDDLIDEKDRYSPTTMERAYNWFISTRSLMDKQETSLELVLGTHWANNDLYTRLIRDGLDLQVYKFSALYDAQTGQPFMDVPKDQPIDTLPPHILPLWPERYSRASLESLRRNALRAGKQDIFILNYFNNPLASGIVDFDISQFRFFTLEGDCAEFDPDPRDAYLQNDYGMGESQTWKGQRLTDQTLSKYPDLRAMHFKTTYGPRAAPPYAGSRSGSDGVTGP